MEFYPSVRCNIAIFFCEDLSFLFLVFSKKYDVLRYFVFRTFCLDIFYRPTILYTGILSDFLNSYIPTDISFVSNMLSEKKSRSTNTCTGIRAYILFLVGPT